jgi:signal peptidase I
MKGTARTATWVVAIVGAILLLLGLFVFDTWEIPDGDPMLTVSIEPNLRPGDRVVLRKETSEHNIGELVRCRHPIDTTKFVVGRLFGMARDTVELRKEVVFVAGKPMGAARACPSMSLAHPATGEILQLTCGEVDASALTYRTLQYVNDYQVEGDVVATVEVGKGFLVSDDRHLHQDSRDFGQVDITTCQHIVFRLWGKSYTDSSRRNTILW